MKLKTSIANAVSTSDQFKSYEFNIKEENMGLVLEILRSKMYKNPIGAICREVSSNSRDANREVGNDKTPVRIKIEQDDFSPGEMYITFEDDGPGISPERMGDVFVSYAESTKRGSNKQTGGFGLGAKTPFAYTDNFTVITKVDGVKYTYTAAIEENRSGKMYLLSKEDTTETNGTAIVVPMKEADKRTFEKEVIRCTTFWDVRPALEGFSSEYDVIHKRAYGGSFITQPLNHFNNRNYLLIDEIPYPVDISIIDFGNQPCCVFLTFKTGQLTISANREAVQYDKQTTKRIKDRFRQLLDSMTHTVTTHFANCKTYFDACVEYSKYYNENRFIISFLVCNGVESFEYKGSTLVSSIGISDLRISVIKPYRDASYRNKSTVHDIRDYRKYPIYFVSTVLTAGRDMTIFKKAPNGFIAVEWDNKDLRSFRKMNVGQRKSFAEKMRRSVNQQRKWHKRFVEAGIDVQDYLTVTPTKVRRKTEDIDEDQRITIRHMKDSSRFRSYSTSLSNLADRKQVVYCCMNRKDIGTQRLLYLMEYAWFLASCSIDRVVFINKRFEKWAKRQPNFVDVTEYLENEIKAGNYQQVVDSRFVTQNTSFNVNKVKSFSFCNGTAAALAIVQKLKARTAPTIPTLVAKRVKHSQLVENSVAEVNRLIATYPLLEHSNEYDTCEERKQFQDYIKLVDWRREWEQKSKSNG